MDASAEKRAKGERYDKAEEGLKERRRATGQLVKIRGREEEEI